MLDKIMIVAMLVVFALLCHFWMTDYVIPKDIILAKTEECYVAGEEPWEVCIKRAEDRHATPLLLMLGY